jgi:hypothetical protein
MKHNKAEQDDPLQRPCRRPILTIQSLQPDSTSASWGRVACAWTFGPGMWRSSLAMVLGCVASCVPTSRRTEVAGELTGLVVDRATNLPIVGATVASRRASYASEGVSNRAGVFRVPPISVQLEGDWIPDEIVAAPHTVEISASGYEEVRFEFRPRQNLISPPVRLPMVVPLTPN